MRGKKLLAAFLLGVGFCFVPVLGYGEIEKWVLERKVSHMDVELLQARVNYMMTNPTDFLYFGAYYDPYGRIGGIRAFPKNVDTKGKIVIAVYDSRKIFCNKSRAALLDQFKKELEAIYSFLRVIATDMDTDIVAKFFTGEQVPLGYFYQGEYHLWGEMRDLSD